MSVALYHPDSLTISDSISQGLGTETCKHHIVGSTDTGTGQHGGHCQGAGGHIEGDTVPPTHPLPLQQVGQATCQVQQLSVGRNCTNVFWGSLIILFERTCCIRLGIGHGETHNHARK